MPPYDYDPIVENYKSRALQGSIRTSMRGLKQAAEATPEDYADDESPLPASHNTDVLNRGVTGYARDAMSELLFESPRALMEGTRKLADWEAEVRPDDWINPKLKQFSAAATEALASQLSPFNIATAGRGSLMKGLAAKGLPQTARAFSTGLEIGGAKLGYDSIQALRDAVDREQDPNEPDTRMADIGMAAAGAGFGALGVVPGMRGRLTDWNAPKPPGPTFRGDPVALPVGKHQAFPRPDAEPGFPEAPSWWDDAPVPPPEAPPPAAAPPPPDLESLLAPTMLREQPGLPGLYPGPRPTAAPAPGAADPRFIGNAPPPDAVAPQTTPAAPPDVPPPPDLESLLAPPAAPDAPPPPAPAVPPSVLDEMAPLREEPPPIPPPAQAGPPPGADLPPAVAAAAPRERPGGAPPIEPIDPQTIQVDPATFQFKESGDQGVTGSLKGVTQWEPTSGPVTVFERADGSRWIADGHQRLAKYRELQWVKPLPPLQARVFKESEGYTVPGVVRAASIRNLQEGSAQPTDIARLIWNGGELSPGELATIPKTALAGERLARGQNLGRLTDPQAQRMIMNREVNPDFASFVGKYIDNPAEQVATLQALSKANIENLRQAEDFVLALADGGFAQSSMDDLWGTQSIHIPIAEQKAKLLDHVRRELSTKRAAFAAALKHADELGSAGNIMAEGANVAGRSDAQKLLGYFDHFARAKGSHTNVAISEGAKAIVDGGNRATLSPGILAAIERDIRGDAPGGVPAVAGIAGDSGRPGARGVDDLDDLVTGPGGLVTQVDEGPGMFDPPPPVEPPLPAAGPEPPPPPARTPGPKKWPHDPNRVPADAKVAPLGEYLAPRDRDFAFIQLAEKNEALTPALRDAGYRYNKRDKKWFRDLRDGETHAQAEAEAARLLGVVDDAPPPVTADTLDTGEVQPRLPGDVGEARTQAAKPEPQFDVPFALGRENAPRVAPKPADLGELLGEPAKPAIPANQRSFLKRQRGHTDAEIDAMTPEQREQAAAAPRKAPEAATPAPAETQGTNPEGQLVQKPQSLEEMLTGYAEDVMPGKQAAVRERMAAFSDDRAKLGPAADAPAPPEGVAARAPGKATVKEQQAGAIPADDAAAAPVVEKLAKGGVTRENSKRAYAMKRMLEKGDPESIDGYANELLEQVARENDQAFRWGTSAKQDGPKTWGDDMTRLQRDEQSGEYLGSGWGGIEQIYKRNPGFFWRTAGGSVTGIIGAELTGDPDWMKWQVGSLAVAHGGLPALKRIAKHIREQAPSAARGAEGIIRKAQRQKRDYDLKVREGRNKQTDLTPPEMFRSLHYVDDELSYAMWKTHEQIAAKLSPIADPVARAANYEAQRVGLVKLVDDAIKDATTNEHSNLTRYLKEYKGLVQRDPLAVHKVAGMGALKPEQMKKVFAQAERHMLRLLLGGSLSAGAINFTQPIAAAQHIGYKAMFKGMREFHGTKEGAAQGRRLRPDFDAAHEIGSPGLKALDGLDKMLFYPLRRGDEINAGSVFVAGRRWALDKGYTMAEAEKFGFDLSVTTQGGGHLNDNPFTRQLGPLRLLAKFPAQMVEVLDDIARHPDPARQIRMASTILGVYAATSLTGINLMQALVPRFAFVGPAWEVATEAKGMLFGESDVEGKDLVKPTWSNVEHGNKLTVPSYLRKAAGIIKARESKALGGYGEGLDERQRYDTKGRPLDKRSALDDLGALVGLESTKKTAERKMRTRGYEFEAQNRKENAQARTSGYRDLRHAIERGDKQAVRAAEKTLTPAQIREFYKSAHQTPMERLRKQVPRNAREAFAAALARE